MAAKTLFLAIKGLNLSPDHKPDAKSNAGIDKMMENFTQILVKK